MPSAQLRADTMMHVRIRHFRIYRACRKMSDRGGKTDVEQAGSGFGF
jgi:hypothetical protein